MSFYGADAFEVPRTAEARDRYQEIFPHIDRILALGPYMAGELERLGYPREKIRVHPLGVDVQALRFRARNRAAGEPLRILFAGTFREKKGIPYLIEALAGLKAEGIPVSLDLVGDSLGKPGDDETKSAIFDQIRRLAVEDIVRHHPFLRFEDLLALAFECHVLVAPSVTAHSGDAEGTPFIIQQMMATGMPVISTHHSDIPHIYGRLADRLVAERDSRALVDALRGYAENPHTIERDSYVFREHVETTLDIRLRAEALEDIYDEVS